MRLDEVYNELKELGINARIKKDQFLLVVIIVISVKSL